MRHHLRPRQIRDLLKSGLDALRFVVIRAIPTGGSEPPLAEGQDITQEVRSGAIPEGPLLTHIRRGYVLVQPADGNGAERLRKAPFASSKSEGGKVDRETQRLALEASGVAAPAGASRAQLKRLRAAAIAKGARGKAATA